MSRPTWPAASVAAAVAAPKQLAWCGIVFAIIEAEPDLAIRYAPAELVEIADDAIWLLLLDEQLGNDLDAPWMLERLGDALSGAYDQRITVDVVNARRRSDVA